MVFGGCFWAFEGLRGRGGLGMRAFTRLKGFFFWVAGSGTFDTVYNTNSGGHIDAATTQARCL